MLIAVVGQFPAGWAGRGRGDSFSGDVFGYGQGAGMKRRLGTADSYGPHQDWQSLSGGVFYFASRWPGRQPVDEVPNLAS
jgi:hypothetical protein